MKTARSTNNMQSKQGQSHKPRPEIRDDMDSRNNEEQDWKGTDTTHNKKEMHSKGKQTASSKK
jgi:hypothetical protein